MAQRHRKTAELVSVLLPVWLRKEIDAEVAWQRTHSRGPALNRSEWIRRAVQRDLAHARRSRNGRLSALEMEAWNANREQVEQLVGAEPMHAVAAGEPPGVRGGQDGAVPAPGDVRPREPARTDAAVPGEAGTVRPSVPAGAVARWPSAFVPGSSDY